MEQIWNKMYQAAKAVQNERKISDYVDAGGVAAAILSSSGKIYTGICIDPALPWEFAPKEMLFLI